MTPTDRAELRRRAEADCQRCGLAATDCLCIAEADEYRRMRLAVLALLDDAEQLAAEVERLRGERDEAVAHREFITPAAQAEIIKLVEGLAERVFKQAALLTKAAERDEEKERLRAALKPFADAVGEYPPFDADCRRAAELLKEVP